MKKALNVILFLIVAFILTLLIIGEVKLGRWAFSMVGVGELLADERVKSVGYRIPTVARVFGIVIIAGLILKNAITGFRKGGQK